jgi:hypothetical protein
MPCSNPTDCVADAVCAPNGMSGTCTAECDPTHACVTGTCTTVPNLPGGAGLCQ